MTSTPTETLPPFHLETEGAPLPSEGGAVRVATPEETYLYFHEHFAKLAS